MNRLLALLLLVSCSVVGCQTRGARSGLSGQAVAQGPKAIPILHTERMVYECPKCGMDYDAAGLCTMDQTQLVETAIAYKCPTDGQPVEHSGKCPRCAAPALVEKTTVADAGGAPSGGN